MKKIFLLLFASNLLYSCATVQLESIEPMSSEIQSERSQQDLYVSANNWMVETFTNAKSVIQFSDKEAGVVTGKYILDSPYTDPNLQPFAIIKVQVKDGASKITISPSEFKEVSDGWSATSIIWGREEVIKQMEDLIIDYKEYIKNDNSSDW